MANSTVARVTKAASKVTGKRFCSHHWGEVDVEKGGYALRNKTRRWICFACQEKSKRAEAETKAEAGTRPETGMASE